MILVHRVEATAKLPKRLSSQMRIRRGNPADAKAIACIQVRGWHAAYKNIMPRDHLAAMTVSARESVWNQLLADGVTFISETDDGIHGFCSVGAVRDDDLQISNVGEIYALYVEPDLWRSGIGQALCNAGTTWLGKESYEAASLWVLEANAIGRAFYEKVGFAPDGRTKVYRANDRDLLELRYTMTL